MAAGLGRGGDGVAQIDAVEDAGDGPVIGGGGEFLDEGTDGGGGGGAAPDLARDRADELEEGVGLVGHAAGDVAEMRGEHVGDAGEAAHRPGECAGGDGEMGVDDIGFPLTNVPQRRKKTRGAVEGHLVDGAGVGRAASAGGAEDFHAGVLLDGGAPTEGGGLHAHGVAARRHLRGDALRHAPTAPADGRVFVAEDEDAHLGERMKDEG